ncbi:hypothetical protein J5289_01530 [Rhizobium sp. B230/85]|uniref:hypothetical protein n=1 Tax=unclassified Rhizobium TaxID=2613769 RepID=UPI001ADA23EB|nr:MULTISPECIES: hypothetical protein [unclassified Rhizobium]MBO9135516.1 hypothetical protein [Rhizobium sp. B209b/85]QXZ96322.1 hypothetical protein J5289_01530 [Rhizobium sp. B230/85]
MRYKGLIKWNVEMIGLKAIARPVIDTPTLLVADPTSFRARGRQYIPNTEWSFSITITKHEGFTQYGVFHQAELVSLSWFCVDKVGWGPMHQDFGLTKVPKIPFVGWHPYLISTSLRPIKAISEEVLGGANDIENKLAFDLLARIGR